MRVFVRVCVCVCVCVCWPVSIFVFCPHARLARLRFMRHSSFIFPACPRSLPLFCTGVRVFYFFLRSARWCQWFGRSFFSSLIAGSHVCMRAPAATSEYRKKWYRCTLHSAPVAWRATTSMSGKGEEASETKTQKTHESTSREPLQAMAAPHRSTHSQHRAYQRQCRVCHTTSARAAAVQNADRRGEKKKKKQAEGKNKRAKKETREKYCPPVS